MKVKEGHKVILEMTPGEYRSVYSVLMNIKDESIVSMGCIRKGADEIIKGLHKMRMELPII